MRTAGMIAGGIAWCAVVFYGVLYLTFPSDAVIARLQAEAPKMLGQDSTIQLARVSPWWVGLAGRDIKVFRAERPDPRSEAAPTETLIAMAKDVRVRVSPWSLLTGSPYVIGSATLTESDIDFEIGTVEGKRGPQVSTLDVHTDELPLGDLLMLVPGFAGTAEGAVDIDAKVESGDKGMSDAKGRIDIGGSSLVLSEVELPMIGPLGMDVPISSLKLAGNIDDGKWTIDQGRIDSSLFLLRVEGSVSLRDPIDRSTVDIELILSDLGEDFKNFETFLKSAEGTDGAYHFQCRGMVSRLRGCTPKGSTRSASRRSVDRGSRADRPVAAGATPRTPSAVDDERERRREEIRERLRKRREERERGRADEEPPEDPEDLLDGDDLDEVDDLDDADLLDDELDPGVAEGSFED